MNNPNYFQPMNYKIGVCPFCGIPINVAVESECNKCSITSKSVARTPIVALYQYIFEIERYLITLGWTKDEIILSLQNYLNKNNKKCEM